MGEWHWGKGFFTCSVGGKSGYAGVIRHIRFFL